MVGLYIQIKKESIGMLSSMQIVIMVIRLCRLVCIPLYTSVYQWFGDASMLHITVSIYSVVLF